MLLGDKRKDEGNGFVVRDRCEHNVAIRAPIAPTVVHIEIDLEVLVKLTQLAFKVIACDQGASATEELAKHQTTVACEQPPVLFDRAHDQGIVRDDLFVGDVVAKNAQPAGEPSEHGIGYEACGRMGDRGYHVRGRAPGLTRRVVTSSAGIRLR